MHYTGENDLIKLDVNELNQRMRVVNNPNIKHIAIKKRALIHAVEFFRTLIDKIEEHDREWGRNNPMEIMRELVMIESRFKEFGMPIPEFIRKFKGDVASKDDGMIWDSLVLHIAMYGTVVGVFAAGLTAGAGTLACKLASAPISVPAMVVSSAVTGVVGGTVGATLSYSIHS